MEIQLADVIIGIQSFGEVTDNSTDAPESIITLANYHIITLVIGCMK